LTSTTPASPLRTAFLAQVLGALIAVGPVALAYPKAIEIPLILAIAQGICAAYVSYKLEAPPWWLPIHLIFMPCAVLASGFGLAPGWYLGVFLLLLLVFWRVDQSRVPLFLSSRETAAALANLIPAGSCRIVDLGCGNGLLLRRLAQLRPDCRFTGIEHAPAPWLWARLTCIGAANCRVQLGDFWRQTLDDFDLVYAFLSPAPMPRLWEKARTEMKPGALLVSNSFVIPDIEPERTIDVPGRRTTRLFCYCPSSCASQ
jgi:SAM-dependent methyltransferase